MNFNIFEIQFKKNLLSTDTEDKALESVKKLLVSAEFYDQMGRYKKTKDDIEQEFEKHNAEKRFVEDHLIGFRIQNNSHVTLDTDDFEKEKQDNYPYAYVVVDIQHKIMAIQNTYKFPLNQITEIIELSINKKLDHELPIVHLEQKKTQRKFEQIVSDIRATKDEVKKFEIKFSDPPKTPTGPLSSIYNLLKDFAAIKSDDGYGSVSMDIDDKKCFSPKEKMKHLLVLKDLCDHNPSYLLELKFNKFGSYTYGRDYVAQYGMDKDIANILTADNLKATDSTNYYRNWKALKNWLNTIYSFCYPDAKPTPKVEKLKSTSIQNIVSQNYSDTELYADLDNCFNLWAVKPTNKYQKCDFDIDILYYLVVKALDDIRKLQTNDDKRQEYCTNLYNKVQKYLSIDLEIPDETFPNAAKFTCALVAFLMQYVSQILYIDEFDSIYNSIDDKLYFDYIKDILKLRPQTQQELQQYFSGTQYISEEINVCSQHAEGEIAIQGRVEMDLTSWPTTYQTREAKKFWEHLYNNECVDNNGMIKIKVKQEAAYIVYVFSTKLNQNEIDWKTFGEMWGMKLKNNYQKLVNDTKGCDKIKRIEAKYNL